MKFKKYRSLGKKPKPNKFKKNQRKHKFEKNNDKI